MKSISLTNNEIWPILNVLNEVCYGIPINNFEDKIGDSKEAAVELINKISQEENNEITIFSFNENEMNILNNSFNLILNEIEGWEFQTRIGVPTADATKIMCKLNPYF